MSLAESAFMLRAIMVFGCLVLSACHDKGADRGTCVGTMFTGVDQCTVNEPRSHCTDKGEQFFVGEPTGVGIDRCKAAGYRRICNIAYKPDGSEFRFSTNDDGTLYNEAAARDYERAIEKNYTLTYFK